MKILPRGATSASAPPAMSTIISFKAVSDRGLSKEAVGMGGRIIVVLGTTVKAELKERQLKARRRNRVKVFIVMVVSSRRKTRVDCVKRQAVENVKDFLVSRSKDTFSTTQCKTH